MGKVCDYDIEMGEEYFEVNLTYARTGINISEPPQNIVYEGAMTPNKLYRTVRVIGDDFYFEYVAVDKDGNKAKVLCGFDLYSNEEIETLERISELVSEGHSYFDALAVLSL